MQNEVLLGLGSNLGNSLKNIITAAQQVPLTHKRISVIVETDSLLPRGAPKSWNMRYLNAVVIGRAIFCPIETFRKVKMIEKKMQRSKDKRWAPRPIDIDVLFWNKKKININFLIVPHKGVFKRFFTLFPLVRLSPLLRHPVLKVSVTQALRNYKRMNPNAKEKIVVNSNLRVKSKPLYRNPF